MFAPASRPSAQLEHHLCPQRRMALAAARNSAVRHIDDVPGFRVIRRPHGLRRSIIVVSGAFGRATR